MEGKIKFGDIRNDLTKNKKINKNNKEAEGDWMQYDSRLFEIGGTFYEALPQKYTQNLDNKNFNENVKFGLAFKEYIEKELSFENKNRTAVEFGGSGTRLFAGFSNGFFKRTVGVCLDDIRSHGTKIFDNSSGHSVVIGDVLDVNNKKLFKEINDKLNTDKVDLIISRMQGPLRELEKNPVILDRIIRKWYSLLDKNGILFAQFEYFSHHNPSTKQQYNADINYIRGVTKTETYVEKWVEAVKKVYPEIEIQLGRGIIRLVKKDNSPEELISSKELFSK